MNNEFLISGSFLGKRIVGLTRKALQQMLEIDKHDIASHITLLVPEDSVEYIPQLGSIKVLVGEKKGDGWNTRVAESYARKHHMTYINFSSPFTTYKDSIICIDDIRYMEKYNGEYFDPSKYRLKMGLRTAVGTKFAKTIVTGSRFSKDRISSVFRVADRKICVIPDGWEHIMATEEDNSIFNRIKEIEGKEYFFTLGSLAKHKNHQLIRDLAQKNKNAFFVIGGGVDPEIWFDGSEQKGTDNLCFTGTLTDGEVKSLMKNCKAFIFPSLYEGFGIPPMEALACGADVIVSNITVHKEIFENCVHYIDPCNTDIDLSRILSEKVDPPETILEKYSWKKAGEAWNKLLTRYSEKNG